MNERTKLIFMRLYSIPYGAIMFLWTVVLGFIMIIGFALLGLPSWILSGSSSAWMPDRIKGIPTMFDVEDYVDDIRYRQEELNKNK
jgi:hypothetical protein